MNNLISILYTQCPYTFKPIDIIEEVRSAPQSIKITLRLLYLYTIYYLYIIIIIFVLSQYNLVNLVLKIRTKSAVCSTKYLKVCYSN